MVSLRVSTGFVIVACVATWISGLVAVCVSEGFVIVTCVAAWLSGVSVE